MKKIFYILALFFLVKYTANAQELKAKVPDIYYTIDFVFTGKVNPGLDSVFALRYKFLEKDFLMFNKLALKDSYTQKTLDLKNIPSNDSIEIKHTKGYTYLIIKKYNNGDIPLLIQGENKSGVKHDLYIKNYDGSFKSALQFKQEENNQKQQSPANKGIK
jgi:hypothetical protein